MKLPLSWSWQTIRDVVDLESLEKVNPKKSDDGEFTYIDIGSVSNQDKAISKVTIIQNQEAPSRARQKVIHGDVLVSTVRPNLNAVAVVDESLSGELVCSTGFAVLRVNTDYLIQPYLFSWVKSPVFITDISNRARGANYPAVSFKDVLESKIPVPPLEEQQEIVNILQQAEELRRLRQDSLSKAEKLASALFLEMFGDPVDSERVKKPLGELGKLDRGMSKYRPRNAPHLFGGRYPFIQTGDVAGSGGFIEKYTNTYSEDGLKQSKLWPKETLCITIAANIANTGILQFDACFPDSVVGFIAGEKVTPEYVMFAINVLQKTLESRATQSAQKNINLKVLNILAIPVPTAQELEIFTKFVQETYSLVSKKHDFNDTLTELTHLLAAKAFSGKLTRKWRKAKNDNHIQVIIPKQFNVPSEEKMYSEHKSLYQIQSKRESIYDQLSTFQKTVWDHIIKSDIESETPEQAYITADLPRLIADLPDEITTDDQVRLGTTLATLTSLGLIAKVSLPDDNGNYVTAYRAIREEDELSPLQRQVH